MIVARAEGDVHIGTDDSNLRSDFVVSTDEKARVDFRMRSTIVAGLSLCALVGAEPVEAQSSDSARNDSYYAYGQPIYAVADGVVVLTIDDVEENVPPEVTVKMTRHSVAGNVIVLDIGRGRYAVYGHIRPRSIKVPVGARVRRGQVLAEVGNSGNSTAPHLHFHVLDAPATGAGEGLAFLYRAYDLISDAPMAEEILDEGRVWRPAPWTGERRTMDSPTCGSVVRLFE